MTHHEESHETEPEQIEEQPEAADEERETEAHILDDKVFVDRPEAN